MSDPKEMLTAPALQTETHAAELPRKPAFGEPCNGCGFCCIEEPCALAVEFLNCSVGPCRALEYEDGRTFCGLLRHPIRHIAGMEDRPALSGPLQSKIAFTIAIGRGCDAADDRTTA